MDQVTLAVRETGEKIHQMERKQGRYPDVAFRCVVAVAALTAIPAGLEAQAAASAGRGQLAPLPIQLPKPMFEGTPQNVRGIANLQKPLGRPRDPFLAPTGVTNVARGKSVTSSDNEPIIGEVAQVNDGDKKGADGSYVELGPGAQQVTIDLGAPHEVYAVLFWHFHRTPRVYLDVAVQLADDAGFTRNVRTIFNNDTDNTLGIGAGPDMNYVETAEGKLVDAKGGKARYVRLHSRGSSANELNHYVEVEVFGRPAK
jgi:hypothetical protein